MKKIIRETTTRIKNLKRIRSDDDDYYFGTTAVRTRLNIYGSRLVPLYGSLPLYFVCVHGDEATAYEIPTLGV